MDKRERNRVAACLGLGAAGLAMIVGTAFVRPTVQMPMSAYSHCGSALPYTRVSLAFKMAGLDGGCVTGTAVVDSHQPAPNAAEQRGEQQ